MIGALTAWVQSRSNVEMVFTAEGGAAAAADTAAARNAQPSTSSKLVRNLRSSWLWLEELDDVETPTANPSRNARPKRMSAAMRSAADHARDGSQRTEAPFSQVTGEQLLRLQEWLADESLSAVVVGSSLPLSGGEGEVSVVTETSKKLLRLILQWQASVRRCFVGYGLLPCEQ